MSSSEQNLSSFVTFRLARLQSKLNAQAIRKLKEVSDLSLTEWRILALTSLREEITLSGLARDSGLDKGQLSRAVTSLNKKALLSSKVDDADHRQNILKLTASGAALHDKILPVMRRRQAALVAELSQEELQTLLTVLEKIDRAAG